MEQPATFYDAVYRQHVKDAGWMQGLVNRTLPAMEYVVGSVLDVGCGIGQCADMVNGNRYHGFDFSEFAIRHARATSHNPRATFEVADFFGWSGERYDTVLLLEVLEHVQNYKRLAQLAKDKAARRIIVTVPKDMPYKSHVKDKWSFDDLSALFGELSIKAIIDGKWLLAVYDVTPLPVSVCMIVRNEQDCLAQALESTIGLADEVVVVDTGSTDGTLDIAGQFGCRVVIGADRMHKARSRNLAIGKALGQWVVILDADECIREPIKVRRYVQQTDALVLYVRLAYMNDQNQETMSFSQIRAWKRGMMRYKYRAHELPLPVGGGKLAQVTSFVWEHRPPASREAWKLQYTLDRLRLDVKENPGDPRPVYYLGRQYMYMRQYKEAVSHLKQYVAMGGNTDLADCWYALARCYKEMQGNYQRQRIAALHQACAVAPHRREFWGALAAEYWERENHPLAISLLKAALEVPMPEAGQVQHGWYSDKPGEVLKNWIAHAGRIHDT